MRAFKTSPFGDVVDLDDPETYKNLPNTVEELRKLMLSEIGYYHCYVKYWHRDVFNKDDSGQKKRVRKLIKHFTKNERDNYENIQWYKEQIFLFRDEIENMC